MELKPNFVDKVISIFSPEAAYRRLQFRAGIGEFSEQYRRYDASGRGRRFKNWNAPATSANQETRMDLSLVRYRSRELVRNNAYAKRGIQAITTNTIGTGIRPTPRGLNKSKTRNYKEAFNAWADSTDCDWDGQSNFYGIQRMCMRAIAQDGEVLVRRRWNPKTANPLQLQVLECDHLDHTKDTPRGFNNNSDGSYIIQGVEFNRDGKRVAYWLYPNHPGEGGLNQSVRVPADDVLHIYYKERPGQVRGVPFTATAAISLYDFEEYEQAQLMRQKIAACFAVFVQDNDTNTTPSGNAALQGTPIGERVVPGMIQHLAAGKTVTMANPPTVENYDEYASAMLRKIAVGMGVSYEVLSGDLSNVNFSSGRMGWIEFHRLITEWQTLMLIPMLCNPAWNWYVEGEALMGRGKREIKASWTPPKREMIDPVKEIKGMTEAIRAGLVSKSETIRQLGQDPDAVLSEMIEDCKAEYQNGLMPTSNPAWDAARGNDGADAETGVDANSEEPTGKQMKAAKNNKK